MVRTIPAIAILFASILSAQSPETSPRFEIADVHAGAKPTNPQNQFMRVNPGRNRYEVKTATMVDLIRLAWGVDPDKIVGGPNWLEMDRFDVTAKMPPGMEPDTQKQMLQSLLTERFRLAIHKDTKPQPVYALLPGKKPQLKEADGTEQAGCKIETVNPNAPPAEGGIRLMTSGPNGTPMSINLGPGMTVQYHCREMTMAAFADGLRTMMGASLGSNAVLDETGLKGKYNFDVKWSMQIIGPANTAGDRITVAEAMEKQLGLKLEQRQLPMPVIVVDSVERTPTPNPPGLAEALPPVPVPTEFEVADVKMSDPGGRGGRFQMLPGGRFISQGMPMRFLVSRAFSTFNNDEIVGLPKWADSERFDVTAKTQTSGPTAAPLDMDTVAPLIRALLAERFKLTYHSEERPVTAYTLVAAKPKMKKSDPESRTSCRNESAPPGSPPATRVLICRNITMAQFAERMQGMTQELNWPVQDATSLEGGWDFTLTFSMNFPRPAGMPPPGPGRGGDGGLPGLDTPSAAEPTGAFTLFEALEKQLGLKLESRKRTMPVVVIDHLEQKPTEN